MNTITATYSNTNDDIRSPKDLARRGKWTDSGLAHGQFS